MESQKTEMIVDSGNTEKKTKTYKINALDIIEEMMIRF